MAPAWGAAPNLGAVNESRLEVFRRSPERAGIFLDFDGTLSDIVRMPDAARPLEGAADLLDRLASRYALVAVVSGRSARQLVDWLGSAVEIWGVHGAERTVDGNVVLTDAVKDFEELMAAVRAEAAVAIDALAIEGVVLEDKGVVLGLHFRGAADRQRAEAELDRIAQNLADRHGLIRAGGRLAFELRPPVDLSKATVVLERTRGLGLAAAAFAGDDRVDLPGFDALDRLEEEGVHTLRIGVSSPEAPPQLLERADVVVDGPRGAIDLLSRLL